LRTLFDTYVGCGGFSLGAKWAGFKTELAVDIDPVLTSSFADNFPGARFLLRDVASLTADEITKLLPNGVDGIIGGPPCQPFSENGAREPDDPRRDLVGEFFRIVSIVRPAFFVMENVRGLGFTRNRPVLDAALGRLTGSWTILEATLDASNFGAPTRRRRLFVFGFDPNKMTVPDLSAICASERVGSTVRDALADLAGAVETATGTWQYPEGAEVSDYAKRLRSESGGFQGHRLTAHSETTIRRFATVPAGTWDAVGKHPRLSWDGLCPALLAGTGMDRGAHQSVRPIHPDENRVITAREAARLQGFPDDFTFHPTVWHSFRMIGNSVCPMVSHAILANILSAMESSKQVAA
jgi:DNA (cytosine-5)-methyltransferase 1